MNQLLAMRAYIRVVESASFIRAASQLSMPRSTVSKLITDLEKHLETRLIRRTTRTVTVTTEGLEYYRYAVKLLNGVDEADSAVRGKKQKPRGHLRLEVQVIFACTFLIPALPEFYREYPDITLALGINDRTVNMVGEGVDCAIRAGTIQDLSVIARPLINMHYITCASPAYLSAMGTPRHPHDIQNDHRCINYHSASSGKTDPLIFHRGDEAVVVNNCLYSASDGNGLRDMIMAGLGVGQILREFIEPEIRTGRLVPVLTDWNRSPLPFHIIYERDNHQNARLRAFVDWMTERFGR